ncbi:hypothetical protein N7486_003972 [Penicillium sp. IBT 16267x]|nr:hypothetical protein N7486_003972 [Penicillium sp. IBT 16267x]
MSSSAPNLEATLHYSTPVAPSDVEKYGCFTTLPVRRHNDHKRNDEVEAQIFQDWENILGDGVTKICYASSNQVAGGWDCLILPEARPERLYYTMWLTVYLFLLDDKAELMSLDEAHTKLNQEVDKLFAIEDADVQLGPEATPMEKLLVPFIRELLRYDKERAIPVLRAWRYWVQNVDSKGVDDFNTIDEYILYRTINVGLLPFDAMMRYVMELDVTPEEVELVKPIHSHACASAGLTNDYWSWTKEVANERQHKMRIMNGVTVLMKEKNIVVTEARELLKELALVYESKTADLCAKVLSLERTPPPSKDFPLYVQAYLWFVAGNSYWSSTYRRYRIDGLS